MRIFCPLLAALVSLGTLRAVPTRVLVIGDSMSEEYANYLDWMAAPALGRRQPEARPAFADY